MEVIVPITYEEVCGIFQKYKPSARILYGRNIDLELHGKEIWIHTPIGGGIIYPDRRNFTVTKPEITRKVFECFLIICTVDEWMSWLTKQEAQAVFLRYIDHSMILKTKRWSEADTDFNDHTLIYETRSIKQIAEMMNVSRRKVLKLLDRAINRILETV